eukprot:515302-Amphidinium_carterae.1
MVRGEGGFVQPVLSTRRSNLWRMTCKSLETSDLYANGSPLSRFLPHTIDTVLVDLESVGVAQFLLVLALPPLGMAAKDWAEKGNDSLPIRWGGSHGSFALETHVDALRIRTATIRTATIGQTLFRKQSAEQRR